MQIRTSISNALCLIAKYQWRPAYPSVDALLAACAESPDPLRIRYFPSSSLRYGTQFLFLFRQGFFSYHVQSIIDNLPKWKDERFSPPRVSQSRVGNNTFTGILFLTFIFSMTKSAWPVGFAIFFIWSLNWDLTVLLWLWVSLHSPEACLVRPHAMALLFVTHSFYCILLKIYLGLNSWACQNWATIRNFKSTVALCFVCFPRVICRLRLRTSSWRTWFRPFNHLRYIHLPK